MKCSHSNLRRSFFANEFGEPFTHFVCGFLREAGGQSKTSRGVKGDHTLLRILMTVAASGV